LEFKRSLSTGGFFLNIIDRIARELRIPTFFGETRKPGRYAQIRGRAQARATCAKTLRAKRHFHRPVRRGLVRRGLVRRRLIRRLAWRLGEE